MDSLFAAGQEMKRWYASLDKTPVDNAAMSKQREAALQLQLAEKNLENISLRQAAHAAHQQASPHIAQVKIPPISNADVSCHVPISQVSA